MGKLIARYLGISLSRYLAILLVFVLIVQLLNCSIVKLFAASCNTADCSSPEDCQQKIKECEEIINAYTPAQTKNKETLTQLEKQLGNLEKLIKVAEGQIKKLEEEIFNRAVDLEYQREIFNARVRSYYIRSQRLSPFLIFLASESASNLTRELSYRLTVANEDKKVIIKIASELAKLEQDKEKLAQNKAWLAKSKENTAKQAAFLKSEVEKVDAFLGEVKGKIAALTARQQALLAEKTGTFQTTVGEVPLADDPAARPDFDPGFRPAFAAFSFGAPHRRGMSQYGAFGRAKAGQSAEEILKAYYGGGVEIKKDYPNVSINVCGYEYWPNRGRFINESVDLETYTKRIYEMPNSWGDEGGMEALKAQAVAIRSYALAYVNDDQRCPKNSVCPSEHCQVYKPVNKGGKWEEAVNATRGWVLMVNGQPFPTWYASTAGGYIYSYTRNGYSTPGIWDTACGNQSCWTNEAWEKKAGSPWFYKGWYKDRWGNNCGRFHPWLTMEEMADILNAVIIYRSGQGAEHILPVDYVSCFGKNGEPWSLEKMREEAKNRGRVVNSVEKVEVIYGTDGQTNKLVFSVNRGEDLEVNGEEFYTVFNLRAPGRISLKSKLFNVEKK